MDQKPRGVKGVDVVESIKSIGNDRWNCRSLVDSGEWKWRKAMESLCCKSNAVVAFSERAYLCKPARQSRGWWMSDARNGLVAKKQEDGSQRLAVRDDEMEKDCDWQDEEHRSGTARDRRKKEKVLQLSSRSPRSAFTLPVRALFLRARCSAFPRLPLYTKARAVQPVLCDFISTL